MLDLVDEARAMLLQLAAKPDPTRRELTFTLLGLAMLKAGVSRVAISRVLQHLSAQYDADLELCHGAIVVLDGTWVTCCGWPKMACKIEDGTDVDPDAIGEALVASVFSIHRAYQLCDV